MSGGPFSDPSNLFEKRIDEIFSAQKTDEFDMLMRLVTIIIAEQAPGDDMVALYNLLPMQDFVRVVNLFDGRLVRFFSRKDVQDALLLALCFYYREVEGLDWKEIAQKIPFPISSTSYSSRVRKLSAAMREQMMKTLGGEKS